MNLQASYDSTKVNEMINEMAMIEEMTLEQSHPSNVPEALSRAARSAASIVSSDTEKKRASVD